jgi:NADPH-dependent curcumin reductase CurA
VKASDFELRESSVPVPAEGQALIRVLYLSFDPAMRGWMEDRPSYLPPVGLGEVMRASAVGQVIESKNPKLKVGDLVQGMFGWQEYALSAMSGFGAAQVLPKGIPLTWPLSVCGGTGLTAYFGLLDLGKPVAGETVVISGAAGATGSVAGQIAKIHGCRVIGIAGGAQKCRWLTEHAHFDAAIDYKSENFTQRLQELCPQGINVYFDNVGGEILEAALANLAQRARVVLCGSISGYNEATPRPGPRNLINLVVTRSRMEGFIVIDYLSRATEAVTQLVQWTAEGKITNAEDIQEGIENVPTTFLRLFAGKNLGKQLLKLADPPLSAR